jgi:hypothetical protein
LGDGAIDTAFVSTRALLVTGVSAAPAPCPPNGLIACQSPPSAADPLDADDQLSRNRDPPDPQGVHRLTTSPRYGTLRGAAAS